MLTEAHFHTVSTPAWPEMLGVSVGGDLRVPRCEHSHMAIDARCLHGRSPVDFLLPSHSPRTCLGQAEGKARVSKDSYWFCF